MLNLTRVELAYSYLRKMFAIECWHHRSVTQWRDRTYHDASSISVVRAQNHSSFSVMVMTMFIGYFNMLLSFLAESLGGAKEMAGHRCNYYPGKR